MLGIGILAILSIGLTGVMASGEDSDDDQNTFTPQEDDLPEDVEVEQTADLLDALEPTVSEESVDVVEVEDSAEPDVETEESEETNVTEPYDGPPLFREYFPTPDQISSISDPLERAGYLVSVVGSDGTEVSDEVVLEEGPETGEDADRDYLLQAPQGAHSILTGYDADTSYAITYNEDTTQVQAALNSNIHGPDPVFEETTEQKFDADGTAFTETVRTQVFNGSTQIVMNVDETYVGEHVTLIDLTNPDDSLHFEFTNMHSNVHLLYNETDMVEGDSFLTARTLYVVETPLEQTEIPLDAVSDILNDGAHNSATARLIAEVNMGTAELILDVGGDATSPTATQTIANFVNEDANLTTNFYWRTDNSETALADDPSDPVPWVGVDQTANSTVTASNAGGISGLLLNAQPIP